jgi:hypothetical protein
MDLSTTLVLETAFADFSTDAGNSALIVATKSPRRLAVPVYGPSAGKKKSKNARFPFDQHWLTREGTPCHGGSFLDGNS